MSPRNVSAAAVLCACAIASAPGCRVPCYGLGSLRSKGSLQSPTLRWEEFRAPACWSDGSDGTPVRVVRVTYELRVFNPSRGTLFYERNGLPEAEHTLEQPLGRLWDHYLWAVRPRVETDRGVRLGPWSEWRGDLYDGRCPYVSLAPSVARSYSR